MRIRKYRMQLGYSQEKLAELSGCHPTYIGQVERGDKNATLESIERIVKALNIPLSMLFEKLDNHVKQDKNIPLECYEFLLSKSEYEQEKLLKILLDIDKYKND